MLKPCAYLTFTLEGESIASSTASAIKRSYSYIAPTKIVAGRREAAMGETLPANRITLDVRLTGHPFWQAGNPEQDATWEQVLMPWLRTKLNTLFGTVAECNNETRRSFSGTVNYEQIEVSLAPHTLSFSLEPTSALRCIDAPLEAARAYLNGPGIDAEAIEKIAVPSDAERGDRDWIDIVFRNGSVRRLALDDPTPA